MKKTFKKAERLGERTLLRMIVEWEDCGNDKRWWWEKYPMYSFNEIISIAREKAHR